MGDGASARLWSPKVVRHVTQTAVVALVLWVGLRFARGDSLSGIEQFCPFGGLETAYSLLFNARFSCATGAGNVAIFVSLLILTALTRKSFCSWVCPVGTVAEWMATLGGKASRLVGRRRELGRSRLGFWTPPRAWDTGLRWFRLPVLLVILYFTYRAGELVFRPYDPYYVLFSFGGHDVQTFSYLVIGIFLLLALVIPMSWCRYLCPLGGVLGVVSRRGLLRLGRNETGCAGCGVCDSVCPHSVPIAGSAEILSAECTLCLECTSACPRSGALSIRLPRPRRLSVPAWSIPVAILVLTLLGLTGAKWIRIPSFTHDYAAAAEIEPGTSSPLDKVQLEVAGVRCVDTAERAAHQLNELAGVIRFRAYAAEHEVEVWFDPEEVDIDSIRRSLEAPSFDRTSQQYRFGLFKVLSASGRQPADLP